MRELVERMALARDIPTYMPAALLAVTDVAEEGRIRDGVVSAEDYARAFKLLMLDVWPEREDLWFRPLLHCKRHAMWQPLLQGSLVPHDSRRFSRVRNERQARTIADAIRLAPELAAAVTKPALRAQIRALVYEVLVRDEDHRSKLLADVHRHRTERQEAKAQLHELLVWEHRHEDREAFEDLRRRQRGDRVVRDGQAAFRAALLAAYQSRCAMSPADAPPALEAAHIQPFLGKHSNCVVNGLLLRADLHAMFDDGLLTVRGEDYRIEVHSELKGTTYESMDGNVLRLPRHAKDHPDRDRLDWHARNSRPTRARRR